MLVREMAKEKAGWSRVSFAETLGELLREKKMGIRDLSRAAGLDGRDLESMFDGHKEPSRGAIELIAEALDVPPEHFLDYRLASVAQALAQDATRANELFLRSLSEIERQHVDASSFDDRRFAEAVRALLVQEEMTQGELAESIGLSQSELSLVLNGHRKLTLDLAETISQALGVAPEFFLAHRVALVGEWLRGLPDEVDALFRDVERGVHLAAYEAWAPTPLPDPRQVSLVELARSLIEIVKVEGPVLGARAYSLRLRAAGIRWETREVRSLLNRASHAAMRAGVVIGDNERQERTQKYLVLRVPGTPEVWMRARGVRSIPEIPLREVGAVVKATRAYQYGDSVAAIQEEVLNAYHQPQPRLADLEHINRAVSMRSGP